MGHLIVAAVLALIGVPVTILVSAAGKFVADDLKAWAPRLTQCLVARAVVTLPENQRDRYEEEWRSHINELPGDLAKIFTAARLILAARNILPADEQPERLEIPEQTDTTNTPAWPLKIRRFLADHQPATPCLVLDVDRVEANFEAIRRAFPVANIQYVLKANPAPQILERLIRLKSGFCALSFEEVAACLDAGASPEVINFGNTIKKVSAIRSAYQRGVTLFAFDSLHELEKLAQHAPGARVYCRLEIETNGADWPLSRKYGTTVENAKALMVRAAKIGLDPYGLSFHVGSQQITTCAFENAITKVATLFTDLSCDGVNLRMINLGGGFPIHYHEPVLGIDQFGRAIMTAITEHFGSNHPEIFIEPGRFVVGDAGLISAEVVLVCRREPNDPVRWVYLDIGRFGGLSGVEGNAIRYRIATPHDGSQMGPVAIAGPTCDGADILSEKSNYRLPVALTSGDRVELLAAGAYITTYASQRFNGFAPLAEYYL